MTRWFLLAALCALASGCAVPPPPPICAQPEVLRLVAERMERAGQTVTIEPGSVRQAPGDQPDILRCTVNVFTADYRRYPPGATPAVIGLIVQYGIRLRQNAAFLL